MQESVLDERSFGIITLPSSIGNYYKNGCKKVKLFYLDGSDEEILSSLDLIESGEMVDYLLRRKVAPVEGEPFVPVEDMLVGDRISLVVSLRASMENNIKINVPNYKFSVYYDLYQMRQKDVAIFPDDNGEFKYTLEESKKVVKFRLLTGKDEEYIRNIIGDARKKGSKLNINKKAYLTQCVTEIDGERDKILISNLIQRLPLKDFRALDNYIAEVTPGLDLNINVELPEPMTSPGGEKVNVYNTFLRFDLEFWYPAS